LRRGYLCDNFVSVPIQLTHFEQNNPFVGDYEATLAELQRRISRLQLAQVVHRRRTIILVEGWEEAGRSALLRRLSAALDPCHVATHCVRPRDEDEERHWLAPFWACLPTAGKTVMFNGSWYRLIANRRVSDQVDDRGFSRACDEINEFESQQHDHGTLIVKLFLHIRQETQAERLWEQGGDPWRRWLIDPAEVRAAEHRAEQQRAWEAMFAQTDTRWSPWKVINASDRRGGRIAALEAIAGALEKAMPVDPPGDHEKIVLFPQQRSA